MRILAVSWAVSDHAHGGEAVASYELVRHLAREGVEIDLVTPLLDVEREFPSGVRSFRVEGGARAGNTGANKAAMLRETRRLARERRYDATHVVSQFTSFPIESRPFVVSGCWVFPPLEGALAPSAGGRLLKELRTRRGADRLELARDVAFAVRHERLRGWDRARTLAEADLVIVRQSKGVAAMQQGARRIEHVPFGVDLDLFPFSDAPRDGSVLYAGNFRAYKNLDGLLRAFSLVAPRHPRARLRLAGGGPERPDVEALARSLGVADRVEFLGHVPRYELRERMRSASLLALPSHSESFGQVCLEAMASGTPVLASDRISGAFDFMEDGANGWWTPPAPPEALAAALDRALAESAVEKRARSLAAAARRTSERFSWRDVAKRHVALYESL